MAGKKDKEKQLRLRELDMAAQIGERKDYEAQLAELQLLMLRVQQAYYHENRRAIMVFEGWDASGKGGTIRRLTERLDPRGCKVWPIAAPKPEEQGRHYLWRFWQRLPEAGTIAIFDRSWYGRVLVERVEGFAKPEEWQRAYEEINQFEKMLADDGVRIVKLFLHITPDEQLRRFSERLSNPYKRWKITEEDIRNRGRWKEYEQATDEMFARTSTPAGRWHAIPANQKWHARVRALEIATETLAQGVNLLPPPLDPSVQRAAAERLGLNIIQDIKVMRDGEAAAEAEKKKKKKKKKDAA
ncbi:polyphosphate kinase 2 family protein [Telmatospirillum sp. J64-1]|uniref:polyphosphate kinase 2 family protein n=1 Tax=Telmatospirillum sp. J64-1 TaxID=2502183 RepID=UPI00115D3031|nr:polyphosphate kinase [Telmatospirillum sp. J64-1]